ncbi:non-heme iron oxygenase ferredoxin subunit [Embleya sp. AB8]|uniref:non-heme iron oxygenase ferredoxin subunit n=1 Tax=Embleya sp. AB8 TaxID=3156304 RepID=UPI003C7703F7
MRGAAFDPVDPEPPPGTATLCPDRRVVLCPVDTVPVGRMVRVEPPGLEPLAVYNIDGTVHVTADTCTHALASLTDGELEGDVVVCPVHWAGFHVPTGLPQCFPATRALTVYRAAVESGDVVVYPDSPAHSGEDS